MFCHLKDTPANGRPALMRAVTKKQDRLDERSLHTRRWRSEVADRAARVPFM